MEARPDRSSPEGMPKVQKPILGQGKAEIARSRSKNVEGATMEKLFFKIAVGWYNFVHPYVDSYLSVLNVITKRIQQYQNNDYPYCGQGGCPNSPTEPKVDTPRDKTNNH